MPPPLTHVLYVRASSARVARALSSLPAVAAGQASGAHALAQTLLVRVGLAVLGRIKLAFLAKAAGGTDDAGDRWRPLSPRTIAYSRRHKQLGRQGQVTKRWLPKAGKRAPYRPSYALTPAQRKRWWAVYSRNLGKYRGDKAHAAAVAWIILKAEGAHTLLEQYGHNKVEILRDTGLLLNSLSPGIRPDQATAGAPPGPKEQVFRLGKGQVLVGTNRKGAASHHRGIPGKLPQRRLWPLVSRWPSSWRQDMLEQARQGVIDIALHLLGRLP